MSTFRSTLRRPTRGSARGLALVVGVLSCWRVSHLIAREDGPFDVVLRARARAGDSTVGRLMDCPYCVSVWAAVPVAGWLVRRQDWSARDAVALWLAVSGGACLLERVTAGETPSDATGSDATADAAGEIGEVDEVGEPGAPIAFRKLFLTSAQE